MNTTTTEPISIRDQHYFFTQRYLFEYVKRHPQTSLELFTENLPRFNMSGIMKGIWYSTYSNIKKQYPNTVKYDVNEIPYTITKFDEKKSLVVITLPETQAMTEAYFVGIYYYAVEGETRFRYFTLEYHSPETAALCERSENKHSIYEVENNLSCEEFTEKIRKIVLE